MPDTPMQAFWVGQGDDRLGEYLGIPISDIFFKVSTEDSHGGLLVVEMTHLEKGGPGRHFHYEQDEWFYVVEGEYVFEVGHERIQLKPGDSLFGPRKVPHVWAFVGDQPGRILGSCRFRGVGHNGIALAAPRPVIDLRMEVSHDAVSARHPA
jgi:quercetin dioxygenase-like cupin family protein